MKSIFSFLPILLMAIAFCSTASAQQSEYRITDDGVYQYLSDRDEAGMVFDESRGTYYKNITIRTFFLETQRKGYIPNYYNFEGFAMLTLAEQRRLLKQPYSDQDCSSGNVSSGCVNYRSYPVMQWQASGGENTTVVDLSPKCEEGAAKNNMSLIGKMIVTPNNASLVNDDCGKQEPDLTPAPSRKAVRLILINE